MKSRGNLVRLKQFKVSESRRQLAQLDAMIADFDRMAAELDAQILHEEKKSGITDISHFAYPTFAKAARQRRDNLNNSRLDLIEQKANAEAVLAEAEAELAKAEQLETRDARVREAESELRRASVG
ncbi:MAG: flagellar export protein FliJ [Nitratireductor sp.]